MIPGLGNTVLKRLIERLGDPESVFEADLAELMNVEGMRRDIAKKIESELSYPGQIKVIVIRETRAVEYAK